MTKNFTTASSKHSGGYVKNLHAEKSVTIKIPKKKIFSTMTSKEKKLFHTNLARF